MSSEEPFYIPHFLSMLGKSIADVQFRGPDNWIFCFESPARIEVVCPWRLLQIRKKELRYSILAGVGDHLQDRGADELFDVAAVLTRRLRKKTVIRLDVNEDIGDLTLDFTENLRLEIIPFAFNTWAWNLRTLDNEITWEANALLGSLPREL